MFITAGSNADLVVLACKTDSRAGAKGVSLLLVETDRPGFERGHKLEKTGCWAQDTAELFFADYCAPVSSASICRVNALVGEARKQAVSPTPVGAAWMVRRHLSPWEAGAFVTRCLSRSTLQSCPGNRRD